MTKITIDTTGLNFATIQLLVSIRDGHCCQIHRLLDLPQCYNNNIETHHIVLASNNGSDEPNNLVSLCTTHHRLIHGLTDCQQIKERALQLRLVLAENGISQTELAATLNITQSAIAQMLQTPASKISQAIKIKDYIQARTGKNYTIEELFRFIEIKKPI